MLLHVFVAACLPVTQPLPVVELNRHPEHVPAAPLPHGLAEYDRPPAVDNFAENARDHNDQIVRGMILPRQKRKRGTSRGVGGRIREGVGDEDPDLANDTSNKTSCELPGEHFVVLAAWL